MISVIIPAHYEANNLKRCLLALKNQDYSGRWETLVVFSDHVDPTIKIAKELGAKVIIEKSKGPARARQAGFSKAKGEILATIDADSEISANWLSQIDFEFKKDKKLATIFGWITPLDDNFVDSVLLFLYNLANITSYYVLGNTILTGANQAIKKDVFTKIGGFDPLVLPDAHCDIFDQKFLFDRLKAYGKVKFVRNAKLKFSMRRFHQFGYFATFWTGFRLWFGQHVIKSSKLPKVSDARGRRMNQNILLLEQRLFLSLVLLMLSLVIVIIIFTWPIILGVAVFKGRQS